MLTWPNVSEGLVAQWLISQGLSQLKAESLTGSSTGDRQMVLYGEHRLRKSVIVGPLIWRRLSLNEGPNDDASLTRSEPEL